MIKQQLINLLQNNGEIAPLIVVVDTAENRWRLALDYYNWQPVVDNLSEAVLTFWLAVCQQTWPDNPEFWPQRVLS